MHELGPKVPEVTGMPYAFARGEEVDADHPAVLQSPHAFVPVEE